MHLIAIPQRTDGLTLYRRIYAAAGDAIHIGQM
jgi:hypothetical protein